MQVQCSRRFPTTFDVSGHARLLEQMRAGGKPVLDLTISNPTEALNSYPHLDIATALAAVPNLTYSPEPLGLKAARDSLAARLQVPADRIALTASTSEAYSVLFKILCDPGDEVLVPVPSYPLFEHLALFDCVRIRPYLLRYDGAWHIDFASLDQHWSPRTRAIVVVNPNNPTGSFLKRHEAEQLVSWAASRNLPIISDEVFTDYRWSSSSGIMESMRALPHALSFCLGGLSKSAGMPQMKLAWMVVNGEEADLEPIRVRLELVLDTYLSVNSPVQLALPALLNIGSQIRSDLSSTVRENLATLTTALANTPAHMLTVEGGWTAMLQLPRLRSEESWLRGLLIEESVLVQPGYFFDVASEPFVVVSLITQTAAFREGITRLAEYVRD